MTEKLKERYIATLVGCALGDTLGFPVETWSPKEIKESIGKVTGPISPIFQGQKNQHWWEGYDVGFYTDDTILTLAIAESITGLERIDHEDIAQRQLQAYLSMPKNSHGKVMGGFGGTTVKAFKNLAQGTPYLKSGAEPGTGNGVAMKIAPVSIYSHARNIKLEEGINDTYIIGKTTHIDKIALQAGMIQYAAILALLDDGQSRTSLVEHLIELSLYYEDFLPDVSRAPEKGTYSEKLGWIAQNMDAQPHEAYKILGNSCYTGESVPFATFMFQRYWDRPIEGILRTINYGGDSDTTGAMFGAMAGARHGLIFPEDWQQTIKNPRTGEKDLERIVTLGERLYNLKE